MAISFDMLRRRGNLKPPRILIYGEQGAGKTTLADEFPNAVWIQTEDGLPAGMQVATFTDSVIDNFDDVMGVMRVLCEEDHEFETLVVDSVTALERIVFAEVCKKEVGQSEKPKGSIEDFGYGKGYKLAKKYWGKFIEGLNILQNEKNMAIVLIGHSTIDRFDNPEGSSFSRYEIDLHDQSKPIIQQDVDAILLLKSPISLEKEDQGFKKERVIAQGSDQRWIYTSGRPYQVAKNRFKLPEKILFVEGKGFEKLQPFFGWPKGWTASGRPLK